MARRTPARWLAPLALLFAVGAILLVVSSGGSGSGDGSESASSGITGSAATTTEAGTTTGSTTTTDSDLPRFYTVKPGDVLSAIADATGVPLEEIERLNPNVDAQTLTAGQKIKLRP